MFLRSKGREKKHSCKEGKKMNEGGDSYFAEIYKAPDNLGGNSIRIVSVDDRPGTENPWTNRFKSEELSFPINFCPFCGVKL